MGISGPLFKEKRVQIKSLGELSGEVMLFGGIYSNLQAFEALVALAQSRGIPPQNMVCTGDIVAYCADPCAVVARMKALEIPVIKGNCELQLAQDAPDCGCGFEEGSTCSLLARGWYGFAQSRLWAQDKRWMGQLPDRICFDWQGRRFGLIHGGARDISRFLWPVSDRADFEQELAWLAAQIGPFDVAVTGHSGIAMKRQFGDQIWLNAGVIGMPPHRGTPQTEYVLLSNKGIEIKSLDYDFKSAAKAMEQAGLTQGYHRALSTGLWPSEDVLPQQMRREPAN